MLLCSEYLKLCTTQSFTNWPLLFYCFNSAAEYSASSHLVSMDNFYQRLIMLCSCLSSFRGVYITHKVNNVGQQLVITLDLHVRVTGHSLLLWPRPSSTPTFHGRRQWAVPASTRHTGVMPKSRVQLSHETWKVSEGCGSSAVPRHPAGWHQLVPISIPPARDWDWHASEMNEWRLAGETRASAQSGTRAPLIVAFLRLVSRG